MEAERAVQDFLSAEDHANVVAHVLGHLHVVRAQDDGDAAAAQIENGGLRMVSALTGSSPLKGSSRIRSLGAGTTVAMNCTFWLMPLLSVFTFCEAHFARSRRFSQLLDFGGHLAAAAQFSVELQHAAARPSFL